MQRKCISTVFWQNPIKHASNIHSTVSIWPSHMESPTELFLEKFFFQWSPYFSAFEPPNKNPLKQIHVISTTHHPFPSPEITPRDIWIQSLITNLISFNTPLTTSQITTSKIYWSPQARYTDHHKQDLLITTSKIYWSPPARSTDHHQQDFSLLAPTLNYKVIKFLC